MIIFFNPFRSFPSGPVAPSFTLSGDFSVTDLGNATGQVSAVASQVSTLYWALFSEDTLSSDPTVAGPIIEAGTGALAYGSQLLLSGFNLVIAEWPPSVNDTSATLYAVLKDGSSYSNVLKDTSVPVFSNWVVSFGDAAITITVRPEDPLEEEWGVLFGDQLININNYPGRIA